MNDEQVRRSRDPMQTFYEYQLREDDKMILYVLILKLKESWESYIKIKRVER